MKNGDCEQEEYTTLQLDNDQPTRIIGGVLATIAAAAVGRKISRTHLKQQVVSQHSLTLVDCRE